MPETKKKRSIGKIIGVIVAVLVVLLLVAYFVGTSAAFLKGFILPRVSQSLGADVTVSDASISPFSSVRLQNLKVQSHGQEPVVQADEVIARYSLMDIIKGNIHVDEATLVSPVIKVVKNADGTSNIDAFMKKKGAEQPAQPQKPAQPAKEAKPAQLDIRNVSLKNAQLIYIAADKNGQKQNVEASNVNLAIDQLKNGQSGKLELASDVKVEMVDTNKQAGAMQSKLSGKFDFGLTDDLKPKFAKGSLPFQVTSASGTFAEVATLSGSLDADWTPTEIKQVALRFAKSGNNLGNVNVSGPFDMEKTEGKLKIEVANIDKEVLNLVGGAKGIDFGKSKINSTSNVELSKGGNFIAVNGRLVGNSISVTRTNQTTPTLDLQANYDLTVDKPANSALIKAFTITATQNKQPLMSAQLSKPMTLNWGNNAGAPEESALAMEVTSLNLNDWKAFTGDAIQSGKVSMKMNVLSQQAGKKLTADLNANIADLAGKFGSNKIDHADIDLAFRGDMQDFDKATWSSMQTEIRQGGKSALLVSSTGDYSLKHQDANIHATITGALAQLGQVAGMGDMLQGGKLNAKLDVTAKQLTNNVNVDLTSHIADFAGTVASNKIDRADIDLNLRAQMQNMDKLDLTECKLQIAQAGDTAATVSASGTYGVKGQTADLKAAIDAALPKLSQLMNPAKSQFNASSGALKFNGTVKQTGGAQMVAGNLALDNFTGRYGKMEFTNYVVGVDIDVSKQGDNLQVRKLTGDLKQGQTPGGAFTVTGNLDSSKNAGLFDVKLMNFNENGLRPFLQPSLGDKQLVSILINGNATANLQSSNNMAAKADITLTNLVVLDPAKGQPESPLAAKFLVDAAMQKQVASINNLQLTLTPTQRGKNQLQLKGQVDMTDTNAMKGNLVLNADSIDITEYYNLYAAKAEKEKAKTTGKSANATPSKPVAATPVPANKEPDAIKLPIQQFNVDVNIGQFYLREIAITNLQTSVKINGSKVDLNPMQMAINGAPLKATANVDLGVPGYVYKVSLSADKIPLQPFADSFMPDKKGQYKGNIIADAQINGAGTTGVNLKKSLEGNFAFAFTNAEIHVTPQGAIGLVLQPIALVLGAQELLSSPINYINAQGQMGQGNINIKSMSVVSPAFRAGTAGNITLTDVLTNSPINRWPVNLSVSKNIGQRISLKTADPNDPNYVSLPLGFLEVSGTLGQPKAEINKLKLVGVVGEVGLGRIGGTAGKIGGTAGGILKGVLGGQTQPQDTNAPAATNATPAPPQTNNAINNTINGVLNGLFKKKK